MQPNKNTAKPYRWGMVQREVIAMQAVILDRLSKGECIRHIWQDLRATGKIAACESKFYKHVRRLRIIQAETGARTVSVLDLRKKRP